MPIYKVNDSKETLKQVNSSVEPSVDTLKLELSLLRLENTVLSEQNAYLVSQCNELERILDTVRKALPTTKYGMVIYTLKIVLTGSVSALAIGLAFNILVDAFYSKDAVAGPYMEATASGLFIFTVAWYLLKEYRGWFRK